MTDATRTLAAYAAGLRLETVPPPVVARAERLILDFAGCVARGGAEADSSPVLRRVLVTAGLDGDGPCRVIGDARGHGPAAAAFLTAAFGHALDFDDTHAAASLHPSAPVVSAALAAAGASPVRGADLVAGIIAGYEVTCRLGLALDPTQLYARGFHPTAIAGVFGAAAAAGRVLGLSPEAMVCAFGIAGSAAAGSMQFIVNGAWTKRFQVGACAKNGLLAALFAADGFSGSVAAIEGVHGLLKGYSDGADPERAVRGLGTDYETLRIGLKPYPNCRYIHAPPRRPRRAARAARAESAGRHRRAHRDASQRHCPHRHTHRGETPATHRHRRTILHAVHGGGDARSGAASAGRTMPASASRRSMPCATGSTLCPTAGSKTGPIRSVPRFASRPEAGSSKPLSPTRPGTRTAFPMMRG